MEEEDNICTPLLLPLLFIFGELKCDEEEDFFFAVLIFTLSTNMI